MHGLIWLWLRPNSSDALWSVQNNWQYNIIYIHYNRTLFDMFWIHDSIRWKKWPGGDAVKSVDSIKKIVLLAFEIRLNKSFSVVKQFDPQIHQKIERKTSGFRNKMEWRLGWRCWVLIENLLFAKFTTSRFGRTPCQAQAQC